MYIIKFKITFQVLHYAWYSILEFNSNSIETKRIKELRKCKIETLKKKNIPSKGDANNKRKALYNIQRSLRLMKQISKEKNLKFSVTMQNFKEVLKGL